MKKKIVPLIILLLVIGITRTNNSLLASEIFQYDPPVSVLKATARDGQVFLTWKESETPEGTTFNVYVSNKPIKDVTNEIKASHHIEQHSARDWWEDPASFTKDTPSGKPVGYLIESGGQRLDPRDGLFVYTIKKNDKGQLYFAVTVTDENGKENLKVLPGVNSISKGVKAIAGPIKPIWQRAGTQPEPGAGKDLPLWLNIHAKGGVVSDMEYLFFGDENLGWRAGLSVKFSVRIRDNEVEVRPTDRVWINRPHNEAGDGGMNAIWTFWYGYNSNIYDRSLMTQGLPVNYTEQRNLWILKWVDEYYKPDKNRWYCSGSSMGGCGTISFGLRHPEMFAALHAHVPIVSYTYLGAASAKRFEPCCWVGKIPDDLKTNEGVPLLERMNSVKYVTESNRDLPYLFIINGRSDGSIPWVNNPPFYKAMNAAKQGISAFWDNGVHATSGKNAPDDVKAWIKKMRRYKLNESFPVFTNTSTDRNPGNGDPQDGDSIGWINRGMDWKDITDTQDKYSITILADYPDLQFPVRTDIRLRRLQNFKPKAQERLQVQVDENPPVYTQVKSDGSIEIPGIVIPSKKEVRIGIIKASK